MADTPHIHVEFHTVAVEDKLASREAGRPIFKEEEFCRIRWVGDNKRELDEPAHQFVDRDPQTNRARSYAEKFPEHYRLFKANQDQQSIAGTPLSEVPWLTQAKRAELRALNVHTLENLAQMDGTLLQRLGMGARELKNQAQAWLDKANGAATEQRLASELAARDGEIEALKAQMAEIMAMRPAGRPLEQFRGDDRLPHEVAEEEGLWHSYSDDDIKAFIADRQGRKPAGNPKRETLIDMANEILAAEQAENEAA